MIHQGDCLEVLKTLPDASVHCCVTSPPYYGLRDYGVPGQIGLEPTPEEYVSRLVDVFREVRRVLRDDGAMWLNLGDSYNSSPSNQQGKRMCTGDDPYTGQGRSSRLVEGLKPKDLIGIPWRVAFALQADGWYLRQDIIWHKPNPMPESVRDRCTKAHEYLFLLSKSARYYFDAEAIKEPASESSGGRQNAAKRGTFDYSEHSFKDTADVGRGPRNSGLYTSPHTGTRNRRSVWTVSTRPYKGAHFATFPPKLIEPCVLAGCPTGGVILDPFFGSGTTGAVAVRHGRKYVGIELNPAYIELANNRIKTAEEEVPSES